MMATIYDYRVSDLQDRETRMDEYRGKVMLIVNTASKCGYTPQYEGLEQLYRQYQVRGLVVLGFPCNQFGHQEPGSAQEIQQFCDLNYGVSFPLSAKLEVNGPNAHPMYNYMKDQARGILGSRTIKWNFTKFLVDRDGRVVRRYAPKTTPQQIAADIEALL